MWLFNSVLYQIYPIGFCGAPAENDGTTVNRIKKVVEWIPHLEKLGGDAVLFNPLMQSDSHGYDTRDFFTADCRLGTNDDVAAACLALKNAGFKILFDGVFNHVGRGFWAFQDVLKNRRESAYKDWFFIDFNSNNRYNDGLSYSDWEGCAELVKLNLGNPDVKKHIFDAIRFWADTFGIDGLRLDVSYSLDRDFLRSLHDFCAQLRPDFPLIGEMLHGDYNQLVNNEMLHSGTNYECYKGLYSSFNCANLYEISYSLNRQFGSQQWCVYTGKHLMSFVDNHDVARIASILENKAHLPLVYGLLFGMPGVPCIYYGSEWGAEGEKKAGDRELRPCFENPVENSLTAFIEKLISVRKQSAALCLGGYKNIVENNRNLTFERTAENERVLVCVNLDENPATVYNGAFSGNAFDLLTGEEAAMDGKLELPGYSVKYLRLQ